MKLYYVQPQIKKKESKNKRQTEHALLLLII